MEQDGTTFAQIRSRLDQIAEQVTQEDVSLDAALDLYDEAVKLEMKATELLQAIDVTSVPAANSETDSEGEQA